jgi:hypothetical protein
LVTDRCACRLESSGFLAALAAGLAGELQVHFVIFRALSFRDRCAVRRNMIG